MPASRKKRARSSLLLLALFLAGAVLLWYFWGNVSSLIGWNDNRKNPAEEKITEQDRKKLDDILKKRP